MLRCGFTLLAKTASNYGGAAAGAAVAQARFAGARAWMTMSASLFEDAVRKTLDRVSSGLKNMDSAEAKPFEMTASGSSLTLDLGSDGKFELRSVPETQHLVFRSPFHGSHEYVYNPDSENWEDVMDGHNVLEMLARDVMRLRPGYPTF
eukprot:CAMPEP_0196771954 /NCGR_PEP_ID=MMETSP1104-20130614/1968_1 /TAXON_ID=33652 /ORGANISM="Cafeteria sp., Strain Caron Lab Isolate" /LENGTH=148 /DNA_ID=CAMNT_0042142085 /DNA_START=422 /DNA_END=868 /DNA_ORIENTATION=-